MCGWLVVELVVGDRLAKLVRAVCNSLLGYNKLYYS